jgi:hypothetical protein
VNQETMQDEIGEVLFLEFDEAADRSFASAQKFCAAFVGEWDTLSTLTANLVEAAARTGEAQERWTSYVDTAVEEST